MDNLHLSKLDHQYAYLPDKSRDLYFHNFLKKTRMNSGSFSRSVITLDVTGAFDNIAHKSICDALL